MKQVLLRECRPGYFELKIDKSDVRPTIFEHPEFVAFREKMRAHYDQWRERTASYLKGLDAGCDPKQVIFDISEDLLAHYTGKPLVDKYDIYQHLMDYWSETMQDDCYLLAADGWKAETYRIIEEGKNGKQKDKGWACDLVPKEYVVARFFAGEQAQIDQLTAELETVEAEKTELEEEQGGEDGAFADLEKVNKGNVNVRLKEIKGDADAAEEEAALKAWLKLTNTESDLKKRIKETESALDKAAYAKFPELTVEEIKALTVDDKWLSAVQAMIEDEMDRISHALAERVLVLAERYEFRLPEITERVANLETKVNQHLERMGFAW
jgi:type I restriction enzyme M protein